MTIPRPVGDAPADPPHPHPARWAPRRLLARFGVLAFAFFLLKGLAWLIVPAAVVALSTR